MQISSLSQTQSKRQRTHAGTWVCTLVIVAVIGGFHIANRAPRGESELAIWAAIQADERIVGADKSDLTLIRWRRGAHLGDLGPTDTIVVRTERGSYQVEASAHCLVPDGWKASIGSVVKLDD